MSNSTLQVVEELKRSFSKLQQRLQQMTDGIDWLRLVYYVQSPSWIPDCIALFLSNYLPECIIRKAITPRQNMSWWRRLWYRWRHKMVYKICSKCHKDFQLGHCGVFWDSESYRCDSCAGIPRDAGGMIVRLPSNDES